MLSSDSEDDDAYEASDASNEPPYLEIQEPMAVPDSRGIVLPPNPNSAIAGGISVGTRQIREAVYKNYEEAVGKQPRVSQLPKREASKVSNRELTRQSSSNFNAYSDISLDISRHERYSIYVLLARCAAMPFNAIRLIDGAERMERVLTLTHFEHIRSRFVSLLRGEFIMQKGDKVLAELLQHFFDECLRSYHILRLVKKGGLTLTDLRDIFATRVDKEIEKMGFKEVSLADQVKHKYMDILNRLLDENLGNKKSIKESNFNKDHMLSDIRLMLNIRNQIHRKLCHLMLLDRPMKLQGLVEAELKERFQVEHEASIFNMPLNWAEDEMDLDIERELENQTKELMQNFRNYVASIENKAADDQESEANKYIQHINYRMRKTKGWLKDRTLILSGTSQDGSGGSTGSILPEIAITVSVDNVRNLGLHFTKSTCIMIVTLKRIGKKGQSKRFKMETTNDPSVLEGANEEATFHFGGPLPQIELALCSYRKEGPIGKSLAMIHTVGKTTFQLYPDKIEAHVNEAKHELIVYQMGTKRDITFEPKKKSLPPFTASVSISMAMPDNVKCSGEMYFMSKELTNEKWKKRYAILMETSRSNFVLSFYKHRAGEPADLIPLDRFVVDYLDFQETATSDVIQYPKIVGLPAGVESNSLCYFFAARSKFRIEMATVASAARDVWLDKLSKATRQTFKPEQPMDLDSSQLDEDDLNIAELEQYSRLSFLNGEVDTHELYEILIKTFVNFKLKDGFRSLGWFTAEQRLMIDEFCSRYAIRSTEKHLIYLKTLLKRAVEGDVIDPSLIHYAFVCTSSSFKGIKLPGMATSNAPDFLGFYTTDEFDCFYPEVQLDIGALVKGPMDKVTAEDMQTAIDENLTEILVSYLLNKISTFTTSYPFGKPKGLLESCFALLERILEEAKEFSSTEGDPYADLVVYKASMESGTRNRAQKSSLSTEMMSPVVKMMIDKCMSKAANNDFQKMMANCQDVTLFATKADLDVPFLIHEVKEFLNKIIPHLQTTELFFVQSFGSFPEFLKLYLDTQCYRLFGRLNDFFQLLPIDSWEIFEIYQILNTYFSESKLMSNSSFHQELSGLVVPTVIQYMDITEKSIKESFKKNMAKEHWVTEGASCLTSEDVFWKVYALRNFILDLRWPQDEFSEHLNFRLMILAATSIDSVIKFALKSFHNTISSIPKSRKALLIPKLGVMMNVLARADEVICNLRLNQILIKLMKATPPGKQYKHLKVTEFVAQGLETFQILLQQIFDGALREQLEEIAKFDVKTTFIYSIYSFTLNLKSKVTNSVGPRKDEEDSTYALGPGNKMTKDKQKQKQKQNREEEQQQMLSITETAPLWLTKWLTTDPNIQTDEYDVSTPYIDFLRNNIAAIRESVKDDALVGEIFQDWYLSIIDQLLDYVNKRSAVQLDVVQINSINSLLKRVYRAFLMENLQMKSLETDNLKLLRSRLESEERGAFRVGKGKLIQEFAGDSDEEDEEDLKKIEEMLR